MANGSGSSRKGVARSRTGVFLLQTEGTVLTSSDTVETAAEVADTIARAAKYVPKKHLYPCTNCGMAPMDREIALQKLDALVAGTRLARKKLK